MAWKVITFLAIFALSEARPPTSKQRVKIENWVSHVKSHEAEPQEVHYDSAYPSYEFAYEVSDPHTHDFKGQHEQRKGDDVKGHYWLIQPDGLKRTVKYHADKHSGFKANVEYIKHWEEENKRQEGEGEVNQEENSGENENSQENENGQANESNNRNENESQGEGETENNDSGVEEAEENREEGEAEESENQEGEETELREEHWKRGRNNLDRRNYGRRGHELKATTGIWQPNRWSKRHRNEELRYVRSNERNDNNGEKEKRGHGNKSRNEERRKESKKNENSEQKEEKKEEQLREGNENDEGNVENNHKGKVVKTEYHVTIHHPKYPK
nr:uncharacterized protein DDB_G0290685-like [Maniola hyperantus]